jgi:hypothetical protein
MDDKNYIDDNLCHCATSTTNQRNTIAPIEDHLVRITKHHCQEEEPVEEML